MLTELHLKNFRCFEDHLIRFEPSTIMVGANNAGKSTVIEALRLISLVCTRYGTVTFKKPPPWLDVPMSYRGMSPSLQRIDFNGESVFHNLGTPPAEITAKFVNKMSSTIYIGTEGKIYAVIFDPANRFITSKGQALKRPLPAINVLPQVAPIVKEEVILDRDYARRVTSSAWASLHFRNQLYLYPEKINEFKELAEETWPDLRIMSFEKEGYFPGDRLALFVQDREFVAEVAWMGHGLQMWLQTMWFLARYKDSPTIILDEPDVYLHADLQRKLIRLLLGRHPQIIVATHSVEIMSEVDSSNILIINRLSSQSDFAASIPSVQKVIDSIGGVHNLQLARLWHSRRCLLVEGKDMSFLRVVHDKVYPHSPNSLDIVPNMQIGGWTGWNYAAGSRLFLKNSVGEEVVSYCIFDSDYHTENQITTRYEDASARGVEIHIWTKKEIENYFLNPRAIARLIAEQNRKDKPSPGVSEIETVIDDIAKSMEDEVFDAMSTEYFSEDRSRGIRNANKKARERLDKIWRSVEGRKSTVSGKKLISKLSEWSQSNYGVSLNAGRILREMRREELDGEIVRAIKAIHETKPFLALGLGEHLHS